MQSIPLWLTFALLLEHIHIHCDWIMPEWCLADWSVSSQPDWASQSTDRYLFDPSCIAIQHMRFLALSLSLSLTIGHSLSLTMPHETQDEEKKNCMLMRKRAKGKDDWIKVKFESAAAYAGDYDFRARELQQVSRNVVACSFSLPVCLCLSLFLLCIHSLASIYIYVISPGQIRFQLKRAIWSTATRVAMLYPSLEPIKYHEYNKRRYLSLVYISLQLLRSEM